MTTRVDCVDLSPVLRIKSLLNWICNLGFALGSMLLFLAIADRWLLVVVAVVFSASVLLARGSRAAALVLLLSAVLMAAYFEREYRRAIARGADRPALEIRHPAQRAAAERAASALVRVALTFAGAIGCLYFLARAKRHAGLTVGGARALDPRPPILLLRSFEDDTTPLERTRDQNSWKRSVLVPTIPTLEETVEAILGNRGPVIAIGRPGEPVPPAGAAREYLANDAWQDRVRELIEEARRVVVILGDTEGLRFEYQTLLDQGAAQKLVLLFPPRPAEELLSRWRRFCDVFTPEGVAPEADLSRALAAQLVAEGAVSIIAAHRRDDEDCYRLALDYCLVNAPAG